MSNYSVITHSESSLKPRLQFWKYNPDSNTVYFTNKQGNRQYPIGIKNAISGDASQLAGYIKSQLLRFGVVHDDQLRKAVNMIVSTSHSAMDIIDVSDDVLQHAYNTTYAAETPYVNGPNSTVKALRFIEWDSKPYKTARGNYTVRLAYRYDASQGAQFPIEYYKGYTEARIQHAIQVTIKNILPNAVVSPIEIRKGSEFVMECFRQFENSRASSKNAMTHSLFTEVYDMDDYLEHHGVKGMRWGVINEDDKLPGASTAKRLADAKRRNSQHTGYYNPNVGSQSSRVSQGGDKTGSSVSSNNRRVSSKVNKTRQSSYGSVVMSPGPKDKQYQNQFDWPGTASGGDDGLEYKLKKKDDYKPYIFKYPASEIKKYDNAEEAAYGIPEAIIRQAKEFDIFLTEGMFKSMIYEMNRGLNLFKDKYFDK